MSISNKPSPIIEFENINEAIICLKYWQKVLFLDDWIIRIELIDDPEKMMLDNELCLGLNTRSHINKDAHIQLLSQVGSDEYDKKNGILIPDITKFCQERVLVHELLHCKYAWIESTNNDQDALYYNTAEHALLEQMSKSLLIAKYDINFDWFKNF